MINSEISVNDRFSWKRVAGFAAYHTPVIRGQLALYFSVTILFSLLMLLKIGEVAQVCIFTIMLTVLSYMFLFSPLAFVRAGDTRIIERMIPASSSEKFVFYMVYLFVMIPVSVFAFPELSLWLYTKIPDIQHPDVLSLVSMRYQCFHDKSMALLFLVNVFTSASTVLTCFYVVMVAHTNRIIKAIISVFVIQIVAGLAGAVHGFISAFNEALEIGLSGVPLKPLGLPQDQVMNIVHDIYGQSAFVIVTVLIMAAFTIVMLFLNYRALNKRNL